MKWTLINQAGTNDPDTGDIYSGLDRFGRVKDNRWIDGVGADLDRIQYGYDRAGNRIWRHNVVAAALGKEFDEIYNYDGVHRLQDMARGTLNGGRTALTSETFAQCWTLDATGNWRGFREDDNGDGTWNLIQQRTANPVNEITDISETAGPTWVTPAYSPAGNMTTMPKVADPTVAQACQYDAWNRLTKVSEGANTVAEYQYDGAKRRIVQKSYESGVLDETRHLYYTEPSIWQTIEERTDTSPNSADAERQFVWGLRYIDDIVVRDRDTDNDGSLDERLYACQDANWNVTALSDLNGAPQERYTYYAYGVSEYFTASFNVRSSSGFDWETLFGGVRLAVRIGLYVARSRHYQSRLGTWTARDFLRYANIALYEYCDSRPCDSIDPFGYAAEKISPYDKIYRDEFPGCAEVCEQEKDNPKLNTSGGGVICDCVDNCGQVVCKGCPCLFDFKFNTGEEIIVGECPGMDKCGMNHEKKHARTSKCRSNKPGRFLWDLPIVQADQEECLHRAVENACLKTYAMDPQTPGPCKSIAIKIIQVNNNFMVKSCPE